jgi:hypothetical protein
MSDEYDELKRRVEKLEGELAEAKKSLDAVEPLEPRKPMPKIDWTEGMSMSPSAMKPMVDLINPKNMKYDPDAWARNRISEPGGFGPPPKPRGEPEVKRGSGWADPTKLEGQIKGRWSKNDWED